MADLIVLSEIDCVDYLKSLGIKPKEVYLSFDKFKNSAYYFNDVVVVCILAGTCKFSKKILAEFLGSIRERGKDDEDEGVVHGYIFSDSVLPRCPHYYLFEDVPIRGTLYRYEKKSSNIEEDLWSKVEYTPSETTEIIDDSDSLLSDAKSRYTSLLAEEEDLRNLIQVPDI